MEITVYSTPTCPWCVKVKEFFKEKKVVFKDVNVAEDSEAREYMVEATGQMGVPQIEIKKDGKSDFVVGFDKETLKRKLNIK